MPGYTFHLIPHTHWDREWYLPHSVFLARLIPAIDDLLDRLGSGPQHTFLLDGQTVLLQDYLKVRPDRQARVAELVRSGRLQVGPWYVLADELIPSGESLIRNLLAGQADAALLGGRSDVLYSPDAFGHPAVLPQLAGEFGLRFGVLWRGLGGEPGQDRDLYRWRGPDGREILLYHLPPDGYEVGAALPADAERLPRVWSRVRSALVERAATRQIAVFVGADHHAAHPDMPGLQALLGELEPGSAVRISRLHDFFVAAAAEAAAVSVIAGELRWSYGYTWTLQGVHGTRAPLKRRHAAAELALATLADPLVALVLARGGGDRRPLLDYAWRRLLRSEFHDSIAGCTSDAVAKQVELRLEDAGNLASEIAASSLNELIGNDPDRVRENPEAGEPQLVLWNPVPRPRSGVIVADLTWFRRDVLVGPPGNKIPREGVGSPLFHLVAGDSPLPVQSLGQRTAHERLDAARHYPDQDVVDRTRVAFEIREVPGLGLIVLGVSPGSRSTAKGAWISGGTLANDLIEIRIGARGRIELADRRTRQRYPDLLTLESTGDIGDTYTYAAPARDPITRRAGKTATRVLADGPYVAAVELRWTLERAEGERRNQARRSIEARLILTLYAGSPAVRCSLLVHNRAEDHRLRARIKTGLPGGAATAGGQFGAISRGGIGVEAGRYPRETPVTTAPAQRFVARAAKNRGLALLTPGFFEYELERNGDLLLTVLRAIGQLSREDLATRPGHAGWPVATPAAQCLGHHLVQFAVAPVSQAQVESGTHLPQLWEDLFLPVRPVWLRQASPLCLPAIDIRLEGAGLVYSAIKPAEQGRSLTLRCYNATGQPTAGTWHLSAPVSGARRARADEHPLHDIRLGEGSRSVPFHAAPHEIVTIVVTLAQSD
jgi:mannosylglycerate hydrolase